MPSAVIRGWRGHLEIAGMRNGWYRIVCELNVEDRDQKSAKVEVGFAGSSSFLQ